MKTGTWMSEFCRVVVLSIQIHGLLNTKMQILRTFELLIPIYQTTRRNIPTELNLQEHRRVNSKSRKEYTH
jgi:hypothetical protein